VLSLSDILWTARSRNDKTGDVPTAWIGADRAMCLDSCKGCPYAPIEIDGDGSCYAHAKTPRIGHASVVKAAARGKDYSIGAAIKGARRSARMLRYTALGDGGRTAPGVAAQIRSAARAAKLALVGYTHHWREDSVAAEWRGFLMASCGTLAEADTALANGWRATVVVPVEHPTRSTTPNGAKVVVCPAQVSKRVKCNDCRLCDASKPGPVIAFREH
jgi:hypothetical protein